MIDKIKVYDDHLEVRLKADIDTLLKSGTPPGEGETAPADWGDIVNFNPGMAGIAPVQLVQASSNRPDKVYHANLINDGDPLQITLTWWERFCLAVMGLGGRMGI